jgi:hypothetical protein
MLPERKQLFKKRNCVLSLNVGIKGTTAHVLVLHPHHVLFECFAYHDLRKMYMSKHMELVNKCVNLNNQEKLIFFYLQQGYKANCQNQLRNI